MCIYTLLSSLGIADVKVVTWSPQHARAHEALKCSVEVWKDWQRDIVGLWVLFWAQVVRLANGSDTDPILPTRVHDDDVQFLVLEDKISDFFRDADWSRWLNFLNSSNFLVLHLLFEL